MQFKLPPYLQLWLVHDVHQHGQHKGGRLAAARLGNALRLVWGGKAAGFLRSFVPRPWRVG